MLVGMLLFTTVFGAMSNPNLSTESEKNEPVNTAATHTVLQEYGTYTTCTYCKYGHEALIYLFFNRGDDYPFYYVIHVYDVNLHAYSRVKGELGLTSSPTAYWDGGWRKDIGSPNNATAVANYKKSINICKNRTVSDIDLTVDGYWLGAVNNEPEDGATKVPIEQMMNWTNSQFMVNVSVTNNKASQYNGHIHVYVCDNQSSMDWYDTAGRLYTMAFLDYAFNNNTALGAGTTWKDSKIWDGTTRSNGTHLYEDITEGNTWVVASVFDRDNDDYSDETAGYRLGKGTDPKTFSVYFGNTTPPPVSIENVSVMSYTNGTLNWNTTYYWKIDVWNKKGEKTKGKIWSFTTRDNHPPYTPSNPLPRNNSFGIPIDANLTWVGDDPDGDPVKYDVYFSKVESGMPTKVAGNLTNTTYNPFGVLEFSEEYHWRINAWDKYGLKRKGELWNFKTEDNKPPYPPSDPHPEDGEIGVPVDAILNWTGDDPNSGDILTYDVWFDTTNPPQFKQKDNQSKESYDPPGDMELYETYYWRIVAWDSQRVKMVGPVWKFTTGLNTKPNPPIIDGPANGEAEVEYDFTFSATDNENHMVKIFVNWGDGSDQESSEWVESGTEVTFKHSFKKGTYTITAWAVDEYGLKGDESTLEGTYPKSKQSASMIFIQFLQNLIHRFPLIEKILSLLPVFNRLITLQ